VNSKRFIVELHSGLPLCLSNVPRNHAKYVEVKLDAFLTLALNGCYMLWPKYIRRERRLVHTGQEAGWATDWSACGGEDILVPVGDRTPVA
jgi:hypothetical protein